MQMTFGFPLDHDGSPHEARRRLSRQWRLRAVKHAIVRLEDGATRAYELLSRSAVPGFPMPADFLGLSLARGELLDVDMLCFGACVEASKRIPEGLIRHVNLFPCTLLRTPIRQLLGPIAEASGGPFCIEINENFIEGEPEALVPKVKALQHRGVLIAIDDVGFGRSSLESLILLEPDIIKIDKKLVTGASRDAEKMRRLKRVLGIARALEAGAIAEGVETPEDLRMLADLGVGYAQGFYWGKPA